MARCRVFGVLSAVWICGAMLVFAACPVHAEPLQLRYALYAGGLRAIDFSVQLEHETDLYTIDFDAQSSGFLARLVTFSMVARSAGKTSGARVQPQEFRTFTAWEDNPLRRVKLLYQPDGQVEAAVEPPPEDDERDPVPVSETLGTLDPLSGLLSLLGSLQGGNDCKAEIPVFDGRRRYDLVSEGLEVRTLEASSYAPYAGPALRCQVALKRSAGFWKDKKRQDRLFDDVSVYIAALSPGGRKLPVRLEADNAVFAIRAHLIEASLGSKRLLGECDPETVGLIEAC